MLWAVFGYPKLLLPTELLERLDWSQRRTLILHELAHYRRRDHWVRCLEFAALGLYWWFPVVWWARRELREAEEECCDAWVLWTLPEAAKAYASALVETLDFLAGIRPALPPVASGLGQLDLLRRRLTMIMRGTMPRKLGGLGFLAMLGLGVLLLPMVPTWGQQLSQSRQSQVEMEKSLADAALAAAVLEKLAAEHMQYMQVLEEQQKVAKQPPKDLDKARADIERLAQQIEELRRSLSKLQGQQTDMKALAGGKAKTQEKKTETKKTEEVKRAELVKKEAQAKAKAGDRDQIRILLEKMDGKAREEQIKILMKEFDKKKSIWTTTSGTLKTPTTAGTVSKAPAGTTTAPVRPPAIATGTTQPKVATAGAVLQKGGDMEKRLANLEWKVDQILHEILDMRKGGKGPAPEGCQEGQG